MVRRKFWFESEEIQELLIEEEVDEANLMGMASEISKINPEDDREDGNFRIQNLTQKVYRKA